MGELYALSTTIEDVELDDARNSCLCSIQDEAKDSRRITEDLFTLLCYSFPIHLAALLGYHVPVNS